MVNSIKLSIVICFLIGSLNSQQIKFCDPEQSNVSEDDLPKLPDEFQTRVEMNLISQLRNSEALILYDRYDKKAEIMFKEQENTFKQIYFFDRNELFTIRDDSCQALKLNETAENLFFGLVDQQDGLNMKPPNYFLHFNNGFPIRKLEQTVWRGIPVNRFRSCQNWDLLRANVLVDYYFKVPDYKLAINYIEDQFKEIPIAVTVEGFTDINRENNTYRNMKHEYNFYEFRTIVERKSDFFNLPTGIYCDGQTYKIDIPQLPESYSFNIENVFKSNNFAQNLRAYYSNKLKTLRVDLQTGLFLAPVFVNDPVKVIHDFNSGVAYVFNKEKGNCTSYPLGTMPIDLIDDSPLSNGFFSIKSPNMYFYLDDTYFYAGQRYERGLICDVFISKRTDFTLMGVNASYYIFELYFLNPPSDADESTDNLEQVVPISLHITVPGTNITIINHYYDFDSKLDRDRFDLSQCFQGKDKINFGIRFAYPPGVDKESFAQYYGKLLEEDYFEKLMKSFKVYSASPLRIVRPTFEAHERGFIVYSGLNNRPEPINHFINNGKVRVNFDKIQHGIPGNSPENCAALCLSDSVYNVNLDFKCWSFDVCNQVSGGLMCSFYNYTLQTDPGVISQTADECDHYQKITETFDAAEVDALFRMVEEAVLRKELYLNIKDNDGVEVLKFQATEIFQVTNQGQISQGGQTSFFKQFVLGSENADFNKTTIMTDPKIQLREKSGVSIDECTRLCIFEPSFECQVVTYGKELAECKWSSFFYFNDNSQTDISNYIEIKSGYDIYIKDPLYNFIKYPFKVTSLIDYTVSEVGSVSQCATICNKEQKFNCRSFNYCENLEGNKHRCLTSSTNIHSIDKDPNLVETSLCDHYSKRALNDFQLVAQTKLSIKPQSKLTNTTIDLCAEICANQDSFFCRSFDYFVDTNMCYLYKENLVDKYTTDLGVQSSASCNHYSRTYYEENGILKKVEPLAKKRNQKYTGGVMFGILLSIIIGGLIFGILLAFIYLKVTQKSDLLPVMKFVNPNYQAE